ncbi:MAG: preprotein translocase subunit SecG [Deltaproteobacteria bacterium]|nr:preprotein translocase subunit SecG [Deltaproteobacteria bacterium]
MQAFVTVVHIMVCIILVLVVLLQAGKGANMGAVFGGSSQTIFGSSGPGTFLGKMTTVIAIVFMLTSLTLSYSSSHRSSSIMNKASRPAAQVPVAPAPAAPVLPTPPGDNKTASAVPEKAAPAPAGQKAPAGPAK